MKSMKRCFMGKILESRNLVDTIFKCKVAEEQRYAEDSFAYPPRNGLIFFIYPHERRNSNRSPYNINHHRRIRLVKPRVDDQEECTREIKNLEDDRVGLEFTITVERIRNDHLCGADPTDDFDKDLQADLLQGYA